MAEASSNGNGRVVVLLKKFFDNLFRRYYALSAYLLRIREADESFTAISLNLSGTQEAPK